MGTAGIDHSHPTTLHRALRRILPRRPAAAVILVALAACAVPPVAAVHTAYRTQLPRAYLAFGFTTLIDLGFSLDPGLGLGPGARGWFEAAPLHPRLYHCGRAVRIAGGYGAQRAPADPARAAAANLVHEPAQAERWPASLAPRDHTPARAVDRVLAAGGICLKVFVEPGFGGAFHWPVPRPETLAARCATRPTAAAWCSWPTPTRSTAGARRSTRAPR